MRGSANDRSGIVVDVTHLNPVIRLEGEHDLATIAELRSVVLEALPYTRALVIDLSEVEFMDCSVARTLLELHDEATRVAGRIELCLPHRPESMAHKILRELLPQIGDRLFVTPSLEEALRSIDRWRAVHHRS